MSAPPAPMIDRVHGRSRNGWLLSAIWVLYLVYPFAAAWGYPDPAVRAVRAVGVGALLAFALLFVLPFGYYRRRRRAGQLIPLPIRWVVLVVMAAVLAISMPAAGEAAPTSPPRPSCPRERSAITCPPPSARPAPEPEPKPSG